MGRITETERDALQEMMNIAFGQAAADLSEVLDVHVVMDIPSVSVLSPAEVRQHMQQSFVSESTFSIIGQEFGGNLKGYSYLLMQAEQRSNLLRMYMDARPGKGDAVPEEMERDLFMELGNVLIGACVGKIAEMLGDEVRYEPPAFHEGSDASFMQMTGTEGVVLSFKTVFHFEDNDVTGYLFLLSGSDDLGWLRYAIAEFLRPYLEED